MSIPTRCLFSCVLVIATWGCGRNAPAPVAKGGTESAAPEEKPAIAAPSGASRPVTRVSVDTVSSTSPLPIAPGLLAREFTWRKGEPPVTMIHRDDGFAFLTGVQGALTPQAEVGAVMEADGSWVLNGATGQPQLIGRAVAVPWFVEIQKPVEFKTWQLPQPDYPRLIHQRDGFCVLLMVGGQFRGGGEQFRLRVDDEGYWRLNARSQAGGTRARAMVVKMKEPGSFHGIIHEHEWHTDDRRGAIPLIHSADGFAFLSGLSGSFVDDREFARVTLGDDGYWYLDGRSHDGEAHAWATSIQLTGTGTPMLAATGPVVSEPEKSEQTVLPDSWKAHASPVHTVDISADGRWAVTGAKDGSVRVWNLDDASLVAELTGAAASVEEARISSDGRWVAASVPGKKQMRVWNLDPLSPGSAKEFHTFSNNDEGFLQVGLSHDGKTIITGGNYQVRLYDTFSRKLVHSAETSAYGTAVSPDGRSAAFGGWNKYIDLYDTAGWTQKARLEGHAGHVYALAFSGDGRRLASGDGSMVLRVWDIASGKSLTELHGHQAAVQRVTLSRDGRRVASWGSDAARAWNVDEGKQVLKVPDSFRPALSPDGNYLLTGHSDGTVRVNRLPAIAPATSPPGIYGEWEIVDATEDGSADKDLIGDVYVFPDGGKKLTVHFGGNRSSGSTFHLDCTIDPSLKHVEYTLGADRLLGIYRIDDDHMTLCLHINERPTEFTSTADNENRLLFLKRVSATGGAPGESPRPLAAGTPAAPATATEAIATLKKRGFEVSDDGEYAAISFDDGEKITDDDLINFRALPDVAELSLGKTPITDAGLQHLTGLKNLRSLSLSETKITDEGLAVIGGMTGLEELELDSNEQITSAGLMHLSPLKHLTRLVVAGRDVSPGGLAFARDMVDLESFLFFPSEAGLAASDFQTLGRLTKLRRLNLAREKNLNDETIRDLSGLTALESLDLSSTSVHDDAMQTVAGFPHLQTLELIKTEVGDAGMEHLSQLTELTTIDLSDTAVTARGLAALKDCPGLSELRFRGTKFSDRHLAPLKLWKNLTALDLRGDYDFSKDQPLPNQLTLRGIRTISELDKLKVLKLTDNSQITDEAVQYLSKLKKLYTLELGGTGITRKGGKALADAIEGIEAEDLGI